MAEARPPIIAIMGHIDHGKSTLLDYIRNANTTADEAGGITQHVSAYEAVYEKDGVPRKLTFLDTPGHEAFAGIRARGASAADIAILVVSAEDGVKPQTLEAYKHIKDSGIPYVVAITKIDKESAKVEFAKQSLAENQIFVEGYGGDIPVVPLSAKTGEGVNDLLEMLLLVGEISHLTGDRSHLGYGVIIESHLDAKKGITAVGVIKDGTIKKGMFAASVGAVAPLRFIENAEGEEVQELSLSSPIRIVGWDKMPPSGAKFETFEDKKSAQFYADSEAAKGKAGKDQAQPTEEGVTSLPLIIKADTSGSLEAIQYELGKLVRERIRPKIVLSGVGTISEGDVKAAKTQESTVILGFSTKADVQAAGMAERSGIPVLLFDIIYKLTEKVEELLTEREPKSEVEEVVGGAKVLKVFSIQKDKQVLGARVVSGVFEKGGVIRIMRREAEIGRGKIKELQQSKMIVESVSEGTEFGLLLEAKIEAAPGDILERVIKVTR